MDSRTLSPASLTAEYAIKQSSQQLKDRLKTLELNIKNLEQNSAWRDPNSLQQEEAILATARRVLIETDKLRIALRDKAYRYLEDRYLDCLCMLQPAVDHINIVLVEVLNAKNNPQMVQNSIQENLTKLNERMTQVQKRLETPAAKWIGVVSMFLGVVGALFGVFTSNAPLAVTGIFATFFGTSLMGQNRAQRQSTAVKFVSDRFSNQTSSLFPTPPAPPEPKSEEKEQTTETESLYPKLPNFSPSPT